MGVIIDQEICNNCGVCAEICPRYIPEVHINGGKKYTSISPERAGLCMDCGHCAAVCPRDAIQVDGLPMEEYAPIRRLVLGEAHLLTLLRQRRSVRRYKSKAVPRETIERILAAAQCAPTGTGHSSTGVIVIDQAKTLAQFSELVYQLYEKLEAGLRNPIARTFIKRSVRAKEYHTLQEFLMPGMHWYIRWYREGKSNEILRDCPALLLFHSPVDEPVGAENCVIAAFHAILMAETLGVGTCFNDILPPACNRSVEIRQMLALPEGREVYASVTMGYPKYRFRKAPPRKLAEVRYLD